MAYYRAAIGGGGGQPTETTLWTNPNTSADFGPQTANLTKDGVAESIQNYDYIKIQYRANKTTDSYASVIMSVSDFIGCGTSSQNGRTRLNMGFTSTGNINYARYALYATDTTVSFSNGQRMNQSGTSVNACIPVKIIGVKF